MRPLILTEFARGTISTGSTLLVSNMIGSSSTSSAAYVVRVDFLTFSWCALSHQYLLLAFLFR